METHHAAQILRSFFREFQRLPSYQEMCHLFGFTSKKASFDLVRKLISQGILKKDSGRLTFIHSTQVPVLGSIQAGFPTPQEEQLYHTMSFDEYLVDKPDRSFILKVKGDSMIGAGINDGDLVIIERDSQPQKGDIVVAYIDNQWTLKHYDIRESKVCLVPANPHYPILYPSEELQIWGIVCSVVRKYH